MARVAEWPMPRTFRLRLTGWWDGPSVAVWSGSPDGVLTIADGAVMRGTTMKGSCKMERRASDAPARQRREPASDRYSGPSPTSRREDGGKLGVWLPSTGSSWSSQ